MKTELLEKQIEKYEELVMVLSDQVALVCGSLAITDMEQYGYKALGISQKITTLESELFALKESYKEQKIECHYPNEEYTNCSSWQEFTNGCADCVRYHKKEVDINTPFFGNSGAKIPLEENPETLKHVIERLKSDAIRRQIGWNYPNEIYIECIGIIVACDQILEWIQQEEQVLTKEKEEDKCDCKIPNKGSHSNFCKRCNKYTY